MAAVLSFLFPFCSSPQTPIVLQRQQWKAPVSGDQKDPHLVSSSFLLLELPAQRVQTLWFSSLSGFPLQQGRDGISGLWRKGHKLQRVTKYQHDAWDWKVRYRKSIYEKLDLFQHSNAFYFMLMEFHEFQKKILEKSKETCQPWPNMTLWWDGSKYPLPMFGKPKTVHKSGYNL